MKTKLSKVTWMRIEAVAAVIGAAICTGLAERYGGPFKLGMMPVMFVLGVPVGVLLNRGFINPNVFGELDDE